MSEAAAHMRTNPTRCRRRPRVSSLLPALFLLLLRPLLPTASAAKVEDPTYGHWPLPQCPPRPDGSKISTSLSAAGKSRAVRIARTLAPISGGILLLRQLAAAGKAAGKLTGLATDEGSADPYAPSVRALCWIVYDDPLRLDVPEPPAPKNGKVSARSVSFKHRRLLERYILALFYYSTAGPIAWVQKNGWLGAEDVCTGWMGISCSGGRVSIINLPFNNLDGRIPHEFWGLSRMQEIHMYGNSIKGSLSSSISKFARTLTVLQLHMNEFTGPLPRGLTQLTHLEEAILYGNNFSGAIPSDIGNLKKVKILDIFANFITSSLPQSIGQMSSLSELYLDETLLTGNILRSSGKGGKKSVCDLKLKVLQADCLDVKGWPAEVRCECCTMCCNEMSEPRCVPAGAAAKK